MNSYVCPFALRDAPQTLQRFIDGIASGSHFAYPYIDDIFATSSNTVEQETHFHQLLQKLVDYGMTIKALNKPSLQFLGHIIDASEIYPAEKVNVVAAFPLPTSFKQRFNGFVNYYCRFIPKYVPYRSEERRHIIWTDQVKDTFDHPKWALASVVLLDHPVSIRCYPVTLTTS